MPIEEEYSLVFLSCIIERERILQERSYHSAMKTDPPKTNLRAQIYDAIINYIISGEYDTSTIFTENELIAHFDVSKSPVREALIVLCSEGILESLPRYGYRLVPYSQGYLQGILHFRRAIEPYYLDFYWDRIDETDLANIHASNLLLHDNASLQDPIRYWRYNSAFHLTLANTYGDDFFYSHLKKVLDKQIIIFAQIYWNQWKPTAFDETRKFHDELVDAIRNNQKEEATQLLTKDIQSFIEY